MNIHSAIGGGEVEAALSKKDHILKAALHLFAERGYDATTVPSIAETAGVGAGTIYRYFDNKETLVNHLFQHCISRLADIWKANDGLNEFKTRDQFHRLFYGMVSYSEEEEYALHFLRDHAYAHFLDEESLKAFDETLGILRDFFEEGQKKEDIKKLPSDGLIAILFGAFLELQKMVWSGHLILSPKLLADLEESLWDAVRINKGSLTI
ncbi:TetR family transcriptional regulator [Metabacillus sp. GX 13764]|uniref:TetR/AcrR family transcriptional regulator n=1 Tax=Metabacillus kandeliae TaxID=2900151 RepID=UPI001E332FF6|nr:TetR/AcrR family transcriptional regulator [Metabacillus kandeliae]MCD7035826.1 TetR family transcriptional regulator [Metabacillus kandeliae]